MITTGAWQSGLLLRIPNPANRTSARLTATGLGSVGSNPTAPANSRNERRRAMWRFAGTI